MSDIRPWLEGIGLEKYREIFASNDIDLTVAPELTDQDLEKLGLSLGHRRKFLAAAAALRPTAAGSSGPSEPAPAVQQVERRQVTVVFTDLVGSTALASQCDPEDLNRLLRRYREACSAVIAEFDGYVAQYLGDGVLAYFGYPQAQEQAAERAVRSALDILCAVERLDGPDGRRLQARVGIATGLVVWESGGARGEREPTVVGETPNLAARLQALAAPGSVLVAPATRHLTGEFFDYAAAGTHAIKGFDQPVEVWRVIGERKIESRFAAARGAFAGPLVGREREMAFLADAWRRAVRGNGHLVLLVGEAGMGKSRLAEALAEQVRDEPHRLLRCQCSPYHRNSALYPITQWLRHEAAVQPDRSADENLRSVAALLARSGRSAQRDRLLIAELLDLPSAERLSPMEMTPAQRNAETLAILEDLMLAAPDGRPVLLMLEDVHWSDPTTQTLVERILARIETRPALVLATHRPEFRKPWGDHAQATVISCKQLGSPLCGAIVRHAAGGRPVDDALVQAIVDRSDGVPLYAEELTKAVIDLQSAQSVAVPLTLQDCLMARLDRLGMAKEIALVASVIGRHFPYPLLAAVAGVAQDALRGALDRLLDAGLVFAAAATQDGQYSFNHSLVQEAAYESLSHSRRLALHRQIAGLLESQHEAGSAIAPELVAYHFGRAAEPEKSNAFWLLAAEKCARRVAHAEAIANLNAALAEAERIADPATRSHCLLEAQLRLGATFIIKAGPLSAEAASVLTQAQALAKQLGAQRPLFQASWGLYLNAANSRQFDRARTLGDELMEIGRQLGDEDLLMEGLHHRWGISYFTGETEKMLACAREGIVRYDPRRHHVFSHVFAGHDMGVCAHCIEAIAMGLAGLPKNVAASAESAVALADSLQHPVSFAFALNAGSVALDLAGEFEACRAMAERETQVAQKYDLPLQCGFGTFMVGLARSRLGGIEDAITTMEKSHEAAVKHGFFGVYPDLGMADALRRAGRGNEALALVSRTLDTLGSPEVGIHISELWRLRAELALAESAACAPSAERWLRTAVRIAREQGAATYVARAESALADLLDG